MVAKASSVSNIDPAGDSGILLHALLMVLAAHVLHALRKVMAAELGRDSPQ